MKEPAINVTWKKKQPKTMLSNDYYNFFNPSRCLSARFVHSLLRFGFKANSFRSIKNRTNKNPHNIIKLQQQKKNQHLRAFGCLPPPSTLLKTRLYIYKLTTRSWKKSVELIKCRSRDDSKFKYNDIIVFSRRICRPHRQLDMTSNWERFQESARESNWKH